MAIAGHDALQGCVWGTARAHAQTCRTRDTVYSLHQSRMFVYERHVVLTHELDGTEVIQKHAYQ
jgi:hypothetical protein